MLWIWLRIHQLIGTHPNLWEFILFNLLSNCATITNSVVMWLCTGFQLVPLSPDTFQSLFFNYTDAESDLGLCGFLSFLVATSATQAGNFFVQKNLVFRSNAQFRQAIPKYILLAVVLVLISAALPAYSQAFLLCLGLSQVLVPTAANLMNIVVQVVLSYPTMKFWIMPADKGRVGT